MQAKMGFSCLFTSACPAPLLPLLPHSAGSWVLEQRSDVLTRKEHASPLAGTALGNERVTQQEHQNLPIASARTAGSNGAGA